MNKYYGEIGYGVEVETEKGIWEKTIVPRKYYGDILNKSRNYQLGNVVNENITLSNQISIIADPYALEHYGDIRYVEYQGYKWRVTNIDVNNLPRIILTTGSIYNGKE